MNARFVCFGELLLRLGAPHRELLLQSPQLDVHVGGAEANVAVALARFGHAVTMVSTLPDQALGNAALDELRRHGVDVGGVRRGPGRMGLYFLQTGALHRPSEVIYDRAGSAFASAPPQVYDWPAILQGWEFLHLSGVTPALGKAGARAAIDAARTARALGLTVVFDGNYRSKLWQAWDGDAPAILCEILECADIAFADQRDIAIVLRHEMADDGEAATRAAADAAFSRFPQLSRMICTRRRQISVDRHFLSAASYSRAASLSTGEIELNGIVDRIGAGDAFAAGVLHGRVSGMDEAEALRFGLAAGCLKHSVPGDFLRLGVADVQAMLGELRYDVRR
ncbi:MAG: sugar kinase [Tahibacter sp.]